PVERKRFVCGPTTSTRYVIAVDALSTNAKLAILIMNNSSDTHTTAQGHGELPATDTAPAAAPPSRWQRGMFIFRAIEVRLRFIGLFVAIGLLMVYWPTLENYWDRWTRPAVHSAAS